MSLQSYNRFKYLGPGDGAAQNSEIGAFRSFIQNRVDRKKHSIEVGPSFSPIISKRDGHLVSTVDHASRADLVQKYGPMVPNTDLIEEVDTVWRGEDLRTLLPVDKFSAIVASHFIEHAPDFIGFIHQCSDLMTSDGHIYLIVPDRRYCFDSFHASTTTAKLIEDNKLSRKRHTFQSFFNVASQTKADGQISWSQEKFSSIEFITGMPGDWISRADEYTESTEYIDNHENYFTPSSFALIMEELIYLRKLRISIDLITKPRGSEFLVVLSKSNLSEYKSGAEFSYIRLSLHLNMMREYEEQIQQLEPVMQSYGL